MSQLLKKLVIGIGSFESVGFYSQPLTQPEKDTFLSIVGETVTELIENEGLTIACEAFEVGVSQGASFDLTTRLSTATRPVSCLAQTALQGHHKANPAPCAPTRFFVHAQARQSMQARQSIW